MCNAFDDPIQSTTEVIFEEHTHTVHDQLIRWEVHCPLPSPSTTQLTTESAALCSGNKPICLKEKGCSWSLWGDWDVLARTFRTLAVGRLHFYTNSTLYCCIVCVLCRYSVVDICTDVLWFVQACLLLITWLYVLDTCYHLLSSGIVLSCLVQVDIVAFFLKGLQVAGASTSRQVARWVYKR